MPALRRSRFTDDVDPAAPHPEYPRPQLRRPEWTNLNGWWDLAVVPVDAGPPDEYPERVLVPFPIGSALSGVERPLRPEERAWMRLRFDLDPSTVDGRLRLHFGAVDWECAVWCDGIEVGRHRGGYDPFHLDVTDALADSIAHELVVAVRDPTEDGPQPLGKQLLTPLAIWYPAVAGLWQTVWLEPVPETCIEAVVATASLADDTVTVRIDVSGRGLADEVRLTALAGQERVAHESAGVTGGTATCALAIPGLRAWSPEDPFLYELRVSLVRDRDVVDTVESYFGAREIGVARDDRGVLRLTLNGRQRFHLGLLDQGWWPDGLYTAPTDEALSSDLEATKAMGFNAVRKHVKVEPARWYWHADRLGVLVWQDMPSTRVDPAEMYEQMQQGTDHPDMDWSRIAPAGDPDGFRAELNAVLTALASFPSIVAWVPFNESWGQHRTAATVGHIRERDPTRLVDGPSGWVDRGEGDVRDHHTYFNEDRFPGLDSARPVIYGEFGGYTCTIDGHRSDVPTFGYGETESPEELADRYRALMATIGALAEQGLAGAIYTQTTDVEGEINGMLTYDREVQKIPTQILRELHGPLTRVD